MLLNKSLKTYSRLISRGIESATCLGSKTVPNKCSFWLQGGSFKYNFSTSEEASNPETLGLKKEFCKFVQKPKVNSANENLIYFRC